MFLDYYVNTSKRNQFFDVNIQCLYDFHGIMAFLVLYPEGYNIIVCKCRVSGDHLRYFLSTKQFVTI